MSKFPIGFMAVFFCMLFFFPTSMLQPAVIPQSSEPSTVQNPVKEVPVLSNIRRQPLTQRSLLNAEVDQPPINTNNEWNNCSGKSFVPYISIEDVLNDELNSFAPLDTNMKHDNVFPGKMSNQSMFIGTPHDLFGSSE